MSSISVVKNSSHLFEKKKTPGNTREQSVIDRIKDELKAWPVSLQWYGMAYLLVILIVVWPLL